MDIPTTVPVDSQADVERARRIARRLATEHGFGATTTECIAIAVSELGSNLIRYARSGRISARVVRQGKRTGIEIESTDRGPGIPDVELALQDGYSSAHGLDSGLPGIARLMDDFEIASDSTGTRIRTRKWLNAGS